ncbi:MAG TPA: DUF3048 domain-containing protein [Candidatus Limnocylindrales bacterium]|jgi:hypothetical protein
MSRAIAGFLVALTLGVGLAVGVVAGGLISGSDATAAPLAVATAAAGPTPTPAPTASPSPTQPPSVPPTLPSVLPSPSLPPSPTPEPSPTLVPAPLTGRLVTPAVAARHVIAVMIDDQSDARPQSGLTSASVVWQAPAEGGIPRYMALFQEGNPKAVGPVRSSRYYFIAWASEWRSVYVHVGGSPQALAFLHSSQGRGGAVFDADGYRYEGHYLWRIHTKFPPHNLYTDARNLRTMAKVVKANAMKYKPAWRFGPDALPADRPKGGTIVVPYLYNTITYRYDRTTNTYLRSVTGEARQTDQANEKRVAPRNVVIMIVSFAPLNDGSKKHRLEAQLTGTGTAWIATNGKTVKGTWRKKSLTAPTRFYGPDGKPVTMTVGQTFIQVIPRGFRPMIKDGKVPQPPPPTGTRGSAGQLLE